MSEDWCADSEEAGTRSVDGGVYTDLASMPLSRPPDGGSSSAGGERGERGEGSAVDVPGGCGCGGEGYSRER